jgi:hypothetical protein
MRAQKTEAALVHRTPLVFGDSSPSGLSAAQWSPDGERAVGQGDRTSAACDESCHALEPEILLRQRRFAADFFSTWNEHSKSALRLLCARQTWDNLAVVVLQLSSVVLLIGQLDVVTERPLLHKGVGG